MESDKLGVTGVLVQRSKSCHLYALAYKFRHLNQNALVNLFAATHILAYYRFPRFSLLFLP